MRAADGIGAMLWLFVVGLLWSTWPMVPESVLPPLAEEAVEDGRVNWGSLTVFSSGCTSGTSITGGARIGVTSVSGLGVQADAVVRMEGL